MRREVLGPPHCEDHRAHVIGCLACAAEVCAADDLDLGDFLDEMVRIGWPEAAVFGSSASEQGEPT